MKGKGNHANCSRCGEVGEFTHIEDGQEICDQCEALADADKLAATIISHNRFNELVDRRNERLMKLFTSCAENPLYSADLAMSLVKKDMLQISIRPQVVSYLFMAAEGIVE